MDLFITVTDTADQKIVTQYSLHYESTEECMHNFEEARQAWAEYLVDGESISMMLKSTKTYMSEVFAGTSGPRLI
jgi:hypothetical protein